MSLGPYRGRSPTRRRPETEERIAACEARLTPLALRLLPPDLRERIAHLRADTDGRDDESTDPLRDELASALEEALAIAEERQADLRALPDDPPSAPALDDHWGPVGTEAVAEPLLTQLDAMVRELDARADVVRTGPRLTARFTYLSTPILWSVHLGNPIHGRAGEVALFATGSHWLATRMPPDLPQVSIRRQGVMDTVGKALRLATEVEVGDRAFDDELFVEGDPDFLKALLTMPVRDALLVRAQLTELTFRIGARTASVAWKTDLIGRIIGPALQPAAEILVAVRGAIEGLRLVRGA